MSLSLYTWSTPNGLKPLLLLEELGLDYQIIPVNLGEKEQLDPEFAKINPNARIPAMVDDGQRIFESGALLIHLAETRGVDGAQFLALSGPERIETLSWLMFQMGGIGPMAGQAFHFTRRDTPSPYAIGRYLDETRRLLGVMEARLQVSAYLGGENYSIADMMSWPWIHKVPALGIDLSDFPALKGWMECIEQRPATQKVLAMDLKALWTKQHDAHAPGKARLGPATLAART